MSAIILKTTRSLDVQANVRRVFDYPVELFDAAGIFDFWLAEDDQVTLSGANIVTLLSKRTSGGQTLTPSASRRPIYDADHGDGLPSMEFERQVPTGAPDSFPITGFPASAVLSWTKFALLKAPTMSAASSKGDVFSSPASGNRHQLNLNYSGDSGDFVNALIGASPNQVSLTYANRPVDEWFLLEQSWNASTNTVGIAINGGTFSTEDETSAVPGGPDPLCIADATTLDFGALAADGSDKGYDGFARFFGVIGADLATSNAANNNFRAALKEFARRQGGEF